MIRNNSSVHAQANDQIPDNAIIRYNTTQIKRRMRDLIIYW